MERATATRSAPPAPGNGASADAPVIDVHNPADGSLVRQVPVDPPERVAEVVARVRAAQPEWEAIGVAGRRRWLERLRDWLIDQRGPPGRRDAGGDRKGPRRGRAGGSVHLRDDQLLLRERG